MSDTNDANLFLHTQYRKQIKGFMREAVVGRSSRPLATIARTIHTSARNYSVPWTDLSSLLQEVGRESVEDFREPSPYHFYDERKERLDQLRQALEQS